MVMAKENAATVRLIECSLLFAAMVIFFIAYIVNSWRRCYAMQR